MKAIFIGFLLGLCGHLALACPTQSVRAMDCISITDDGFEDFEIQSVDLYPAGDIFHFDIITETSAGRVKIPSETTGDDGVTTKFTCDEKGFTQAQTFKENMATSSLEFIKDGFVQKGTVFRAPADCEGDDCENLIPVEFDIACKGYTPI